MRQTFMLPDVLPFARKGNAPSPDVAVASRPMLLRLTTRLQRWHRETAQAKRWGVPDLFFFRDDQPSRPGDTLPPDLSSIIDDARTILSESVETRRVARAMPALIRAVKASTPERIPALRELDRLLSMPDDEVIRVIVPAARAGYRVLVRGVSDLAQFQVLLLARVIGDPARGGLVGKRPDPSIVDRFEQGRGTDSLTYAPRYQMFRPAALRSDGTLPGGFDGVDHWLHGPECLSTLGRIRDERTVLLGERAYPTEWEARSQLPRVMASLDMIEVMTAAQVSAWIETQTGTPLPERQPSIRRVA